MSFAIRTALCVMAVVLILVIANSGCGPSTASIQNTVQQGMQATAMSMLSQVDWKQITASLRGQVGPDFELDIKGYIEQSAGIRVKVRGGEVEWNMQGSGTGGRDNSDMVPELMDVMQRWERADDRAKADRRRWTEEVTKALFQAWEREQAAKAATQPASAPAS